MALGESAIRPYIAVVIPSLNGDVEKLVAHLNRQTWPPNDIRIVHGVKPNGKARNTGVERIVVPKSGVNDYILVFIDDDALPGCENLIEQMLQPLMKGSENGTIQTGVTGVARVLPPDASWFERRAAAEIPRTVNSVPKEPVVTNPPLVGYGHSLLTTTCCALWKSTYMRAGGFSDELTSGVDTDLFYRIRQLGYQFVMVPEVYVEHPAPATPGDLWRKYYWYGKGYAQEAQKRPKQRMGFRLSNSILRGIFLIGATLWLLPNIIILYSFGYPVFAIGFRPLKALSTYAVAWGYAAGWQDKR